MLVAKRPRAALSIPAIGVIGVIGALSWSGCGTPTTADDQRLIVWINSDKGYRGLQQIGDRFTEATGVPVVVEHPQDATNKFQQAASSGKGPDIFIWPHDRLGEWRAGGLVAEIQPSLDTRNALEDKGWDAFTIGGRLWGYPIAFEAVCLLYNKALLPEPPQRFDQLPAIQRRLQATGKRAILWEFAKVYFTYGLLAANGGYAFARRDNGTYDADDIGVASPGAVQGLAVISELVESGLMPRSATYNDAESAMAAGQLAMMIGGAWSWNNLARAGVDLGVAPIPAVGDRPARPFVGVLGAMINQASRKKDIAAEFIEHYLLQVDGLQLINDDKPIGVPAHKGFYRTLADDPRIHATMMSVRDGVLMPNNPEMGGFWGAMDTALENVAQGRQAPQRALETAAMRMRKSR